MNRRPSENRLSAPPPSRFRPANSSSSSSSTNRAVSSNNTYSRPNIRNSQHSKSTKDCIQEQKENSSDLPFITGTCPYMCPVEERAQRERLRDLAVFERLHGNPVKSSPGLAVKKFCRTISSKHIKPSDVRPLPVLEDTLKYLLCLLDSTEQPFDVVHDFISDRTRSIRQDLTIQNISNEKAISLYEEMVKFHIISHQKLRRCSAENSSSARYLNMEQLEKTLVSLYNLYDNNRVGNFIYKNEAEFRSIYVLLHLDSGNKTTGESLSLWISHASSLIMKSTEMCFARSVLRYFRMGNFKHLFCIIAAEASYLQYCILEPHISEVRILALSCINHCGYKLHPYPFRDLSKILMMKESDLESLCNSCGLATCTDECGEKFLPTKQTTFRRPNGELQNYSLLGLQQFED